MLYFSKIRYCINGELITDIQIIIYITLRCFNIKDCAYPTQGGFTGGTKLFAYLCLGGSSGKTGLSSGFDSGKCHAREISMIIEPASSSRDKIHLFDCSDCVLFYLVASDTWS